MTHQSDQDKSKGNIIDSNIGYIKTIPPKMRTNPKKASVYCTMPTQS